MKIFLNKSTTLAFHLTLEQATEALKQANAKKIDGITFSIEPVDGRFEKCSDSTKPEPAVPKYNLVARSSHMDNAHQSGQDHFVINIPDAEPKAPKTKKR